MLALRTSDVAIEACVAKISDCKVFNHSNRNILNPKQMFKRLSIALAQVKMGNTSENFINEIRILEN